MLTDQDTLAPPFIWIDDAEDTPVLSAVAILPAIYTHTQFTIAIDKSTHKIILTPLRLLIQSNH